MNGSACLDVGDDKHVNFGKQPLGSPTPEAPAVSDPVMRRDADVSDSARSCSCPVCLNLHTNRLSSKSPTSDSVPRAHYSCRLPACAWMARGLDGAGSESLHQRTAPAREIPFRAQGTVRVPRRALPIRHQTLGRSDAALWLEALYGYCSQVRVSCGLV